MKQYLSTLNEREKWMIITAGLCLFIYCYYLLLYSPLSNRVAQQSLQLIEKKQTLDWMNTVRGQSRPTQNKQTVDNAQLLTLLTTQLKNNPQLKFPYQLQQTGSGDIQLSFDAVPFNQFMDWLKKFNQSYTIVIKQFDVEHGEKQGITKLVIIISA